MAGGKRRRSSWAALGEVGRLVGYRWEDERIAGSMGENFVGFVSGYCWPGGFMLEAKAGIDWARAAF